MSNSEEVKVNEEFIRKMIRMNGDGTQSDTIVKDENVIEMPTPPPEIRQKEPSGSEPKRVYAKRKKKEETEGYAERFFVNDRLRDRVTLNLSGELYDRIKRFLPVIAPGLNMTSYLNNIIADHLDQNWEEINEMFNKEINKPLL